MIEHESEYGLDPQGRARYYGLYSGIVLPGTDPLGRNRLKIQVPHVTGVEKHNWAKACLPITDNSYHPDHKAHTAAQIAALLTTTATTASDPQGGSVTIPALTVVAKSGAGTLSHTHVSQVDTMLSKVGAGTSATYLVTSSPTTTVDTLETSKYSHGQTAPDGTTTPEHTFHRTLPAPGQLIWVMFENGDPEYPVWIGVQS